MNTIPASEPFALARRGLPLAGSLPSLPRAAWLPASARSRVLGVAERPLVLPAEDEDELDEEGDEDSVPGRSMTRPDRPDDRSAPAVGPDPARPSLPGVPEAAQPLSTRVPSPVGEPVLPDPRPHGEVSAGSPLEGSTRAGQPPAARAQVAGSASVAAPSAPPPMQPPSARPAAIGDELPKWAPRTGDAQAKPNARVAGAAPVPHDRAVAGQTPRAEPAMPQVPGAAGRRNEEPSLMGRPALARQSTFGAASLAPSSLPGLAASDATAPAAPATIVVMGLPDTPAPSTAAPASAADLVSLLAPLPVPTRTLRIDRVQVSLQGTPPAASPIAASAATPSTPRPAGTAPARSYRNPWASYHARRD